MSNAGRFEVVSGNRIKTSSPPSFPPCFSLSPRIRCLLQHSGCSQCSKWQTYRQAQCNKIRTLNRNGAPVAIPPPPLMKFQLQLPPHFHQRTSHQIAAAPTLPPLLEQVNSPTDLLVLIDCPPSGIYSIRPLTPASFADPIRNHCSRSRSPIVRVKGDKAYCYDEGRLDRDRLTYRTLIRNELLFGRLLGNCTLSLTSVRPFVQPPHA